MILADTSVWADHIRDPSAVLLDLLNDHRLVMHPLVIGELALGTLPRRTSFLSDLRDIQSVPMAEHEEVMTMIETNRIAGQGLGWVDVNLLASVRLVPDLRLWTRDKRLHRTADTFGCAARFDH